MKRIVLLLFVIVVSLFFSFGEVFAEDIGNNIENNIVNNIEDNIENNIVNNIEDNIENNTSQEIEVITNDINITNERSKPSLKDIFGDDQTFPFVAGFGKD